MFNDSIELGELGRITGREPGQPVVSLTALKRDHAAKSWLFNKYYNICFVDKNPEGNADAPPLQDESEWEHRVVKQIVWWRRKGFAVETHLHGDVDVQSIEPYPINVALHAMIRDSPRNTRRMLSQPDRDGNREIFSSGSSSSSDGDDSNDDDTVK